jgi:hypothetical protein
MLGRHLILRLAKRLGMREDFWEDDEQALDEWLAPSRVSFEELKTRRTLLPTVRSGWTSFPTPSGKVEILCERLKEVSLSTLPLWPGSRHARAAGGFPLIMTNAKEEIFANTGCKMLAGLRYEAELVAESETAEKRPEDGEGVHQTKQGIR